MGQIKTFRKSIAAKDLHPGLAPRRGEKSNRLMPATLSGVVAPQDEEHRGVNSTEYKLISYTGAEYSIVADDEWRAVLEKYCWEDVRVIGLLNVSDKTLIPKKVYPKGPTGENGLGWESEKRTWFAPKIMKHVNEFLIVPVAILAIFTA